jgi:phytanoyl-CoA hydroxylase
MSGHDTGTIEATSGDRPMALSADQVREFRDQGFVRMPGRLEPDLIAELSEFLERHLRLGKDGPVWAGGQMKLYGFIARAGDLGFRLAKHPLILSALEPLLGPNVILQLNRHNQASMNGPGEAEPRFHRDILQWSRHLVTVIVYLTDSNERNGCTHIIPRSQYAPFVGVPQLEGGGTWMDEHPEFEALERQVLPIPMAKGEVLFMDSLVFHSVGVNTSGESRQSIVLGYRSVDELDPRPLDRTQLLVAGVDLYRGNDRTSERADAT